MNAQAGPLVVDWGRDGKVNIDCGIKRVCRGTVGVGIIMIRVEEDATIVG